MRYKGLLFFKATWSAIFPLSDFFKASDVNIERIFVKIKIRPYVAWATNELKFSATNIVR